LGQFCHPLSLALRASFNIGVTDSGRQFHQCVSERQMLAIYIFLSGKFSRASTS
jgi:hypothetical protein